MYRCKGAECETVLSIEYSKNGEKPWTQVARHSQLDGWTRSHWSYRGAYTHWRYRLLKKPTDSHSYSGIEWVAMGKYEKQIPNSCVPSTISHHFNNAQLSDICFVVESKEIRVHKLILVMRSEYFGKMLNGTWKESLSNSIEIHTYSYNVFFAYLQFLYTDSLSTNLSYAELMHLLDLSRSYYHYELYGMVLERVLLQISFGNNTIPIAWMAKKLKLDFVLRQCENNLVDLADIRIDNVLASLKLSVKLGFNQFQEECVAVMKENAKKLFFSAQFSKEMESQEFRDLFKSLE